MNPKAHFIVFLPKENIVSKIGMILTDYTEAHDDHVVTYRQVNEIIERYYNIMVR